MSIPQRNSIVSILAVIAYYALWRLGNAYALAHPDANVPNDPLVVCALLDLVLGFGLYFAFRGSSALRIGLSAVTPVLAAILMEITVGSDPAYPNIVLLISGPMALLFFIGAVLGSALDGWIKRRKGKIVA